MEGSHLSPGQGTFRKIGVQFWRKVGACHCLTNRFQMEAPVAPSRRLQRPRRLHEALVKTSRTLRGGATASPLRERFMKAPGGLHEAFAKTSRRHSAKLVSKGLRDCSVKASRSTRGVSAGSRLRDGTATSSRRPRGDIITEAS